MKGLVNSASGSPLFIYVRVNSSHLTTVGVLHMRGGNLVEVLAFPFLIASTSALQLSNMLLQNIYCSSFLPGQSLDVINRKLKA